MPPSAFICGISGPVLLQEEREFLAHFNPAGLILFERNCDHPDQLRRLCDGLRETIGGDELLIFVDQEGGRVQRIKFSEWLDFPAALKFGRVRALHPDTGLEMVRLCYKLLARNLTETGINGNCVPVLDLPQPGAHPIIGDRAYGNEPETVIELGREVISAHLSQGVIPVMKHIPGHGRAKVDSHTKLPVISVPGETLLEWDYLPFRALNNCPAAMTAHILFTELDAENPVSHSREIISEIIRGTIGFQGLLMSDDLSMGALSGTLSDRTRKAIDAGCDLALHCNGNMSEMIEVAEMSPVLEGDRLTRYQSSLNCLGESTKFDIEGAEEIIKQLLNL